MKLLGTTFGGPLSYGFPLVALVLVIVDFTIDLLARDAFAFPTSIAAIAGLAVLIVYWGILRSRLFDQERRNAAERAGYIDRIVHRTESLRLAQEVAGSGMWDTDLATGESTWSPMLCRLAGLPEDTPAGPTSLVDITHPDDRNRVEGALSGEPGPLELEFRVQRPDGEERWVSARGNIFAGADGVPNRIVVVAVDVTARRTAAIERKGLEQQLLQAQKLESVGRLAGGVAHDFNNILLAIRGFGELALRSVKAGGDPSEEITEMLASADRAAAVTHQLLAFSRQQILRAETLDLNDIATSIGKLLKQLIGEDIEFVTVPSAEPAYVHADRGQIEQVIANLAINARDAMPEGGSLVVEVGIVQLDDDRAPGPGPFAMLAVTDTGAGMDGETAGQVFEPFFTTKDDGTGLGLATVHGIVQQSGGAIFVYSEPGEGTTFKIYLPLVPAPGAAEPRGPVTAPAPANTGDTILLVEDDPQVRSIIRRMLESWNYHVIAASDANEAQLLARDYIVDLLLTDIILPGKNGRELAQYVRSIQPGVAVLYMSGYTDDTIVRRSILTHETAFIQKPFGSDQLAQRIRSLLDRVR